MVYWHDTAFVILKLLAAVDPVTILVNIISINTGSRTLLNHVLEFWGLVLPILPSNRSSGFVS